MRVPRMPVPLEAYPAALLRGFVGREQVEAAWEAALQICEAQTGRVVCKPEKGKIVLAAIPFALAVRLLDYGSPKYFFVEVERVGGSAFDCAPVARGIMEAMQKQAGLLWESGMGDRSVPTARVQRPEDDVMTV